jgi:uncharacterized membrane protein YkvA (DUF1232 family)
MKETPMFEHAATWHDASFDEAPRDEDTVRRGFWVKLRRVGASVPFAEDLLAAYYCAFDRDTPLQVKAALLGALAYFVLPFDAVPDVLPMVGFTDDAAVLATAIRMVATSITPAHRAAARAALARGVA